MEARYRRVVDLVELTDLLQVERTGITIDEIADRFAVSRRTAERMLRALRERYPDLAAEVRHGRKYWRFRGSGRAVAFQPATDAWASARQLAEGMAQRVEEPLSALLHVADEADADDDRHDEIVLLARRMRHVLDRSLQLFRMEEPKREPVDLGALLSGVVDAARPAARAAGVELRSLVTDATPWFEADRDMLAHALSALVNNAIEASPRGGRVLIEALSGVHSGSRRFRVDDEGLGVDPACRARIFEPYFTTKDGAAGLGLALASSSARRHGGRVVLAATPGAGASFLLEIATGHGHDHGPGDETPVA
jgi:signal transduction histidine kinase